MHPDALRDAIPARLQELLLLFSRGSAGAHEHFHSVLSDLLAELK